MHKSTGVTAALAAGVMTFVFGAANAAPLSPRADQGLTVAAAKNVKATQAKPTQAKASHAKPARATSSQAKPTQAKPTQAKLTKRAVDKVQKASWTRPKKAIARKQARKPRKVVDTMTTASIAPVEVLLPKAATGSGQYSAIIARYAASYGVPVSLAQAVISIESNYRPNMVGSAGEIGLMQIKPATARMMGYSGSAQGLFDPDTNIRYGMKYLAMAQNLGGGTTCGTILKYNAGHAATRMNPISAAYCSKVKVEMAAL
jgi:soluble lytic murein transglycosylase-like protein